MKRIQQARLYFHTLRYLKPVQVWGRILFRLVRAEPNLAAAPGLSQTNGTWLGPASRRCSMLSPSRFRFLNQEYDLASAAGGNSGTLPKLWLYNLHYFDDLNAEGASGRAEWHRALISRWVKENPPGQGTGWEPYPLSLRIINWIKWALAGNELDEAALHSLAVQVRYLTKRLERHILGNHLFVNAKALVFAGCFFEGSEAGDWLQLGMSILEREIPEQILVDGGQFERSPMYHALAYEDMLDLINLSGAYPAAFKAWHGMSESWHEVIKRMGHWLHVMCHPDGEISLFNDSAMGVAPSPDDLFNYADRLGLLPGFEDKEIVHLESSGYIRVSRGPVVLLIDAAPIGPDYLPGHAHADTLSYELSLYGKRIIVNSGTSRYGLGGEREWERGTAAHSTVEIDGQNSSEVWAGFRVARRAYPFGVAVRREDDAVVVEAAHDGYSRLPGHPVHRRRWVLDANRLDVFDIIEGGFSEAVSRVYFHPEVQIEKTGSGGTASRGGSIIHWDASAIESRLESSHWHPEFGLNVVNLRLAIRITPATRYPHCRFTLAWA